jgi:CDGSH-type Zn-finger protein
VDHLSSPDDAEDTGPLRIRATEDGPFVVEGPVTIEAADESTISGHRGALCRCGASGSKPFCDGSHSDVGFEG